MNFEGYEGIKSFGNFKLNWEVKSNGIEWEIIYNSTNLKHLSPENSRMNGFINFDQINNSFSTYKDRVDDLFHFPIVEYKDFREALDFIYFDLCDRVKALKVFI